MAVINPATVKLAIQAGSHLKEHWPKYLIAGVVLLLGPFLIITTIITTMFSWMGWSSEEPMKLEPYKTFAAKHKISYEEMLAVDLGYHRMEIDRLNISLVKDAFVYEEIVEEPVYKTRIDETTGMTVTTGEIDYYDTYKVTRTRSFYDAMASLGMDIEQKTLAEEALSQMVTTYGGSKVFMSTNVTAFEPIVRKYAIENRIENQVDLILAMIMQESGGRGLDVMQSSESQGLPVNTITDPETSIKVGVKYFAERYFQANGDVKLALQSYNFGAGFIDWAVPRGGYNKENAVSYSTMMAREKGWSRFGDINYVDNVMRYVRRDFNQIYNVPQLVATIEPILGLQYLMGGRKPSDGGIDCSGLFEWAFNQMGMSFSGTAASQYAKTVALPQGEQPIPGDFVFWETYKAGPSHIQLYVGNDKVLNSQGSTGVSYSTLSGWENYCQKEGCKFLGFRRWKG